MKSVLKNPYKQPQKQLKGRNLKLKSGSNESKFDLIHTEAKSVAEQFRDPNFRKAKADETAKLHANTHQLKEPSKMSSSINNYYSRVLQNKQFKEDELNRAKVAEADPKLALQADSNRASPTELGYQNDQGNDGNECESETVQIVTTEDKQKEVAENSKEQKSTTAVKMNASRKVSKQPTSFKQATFHTIKDPHEKSFRLVPIKTNVYDKNKKLVEVKETYKHYCVICSRTFAPLDKFRMNRHLDSGPHADNVARYFQRMRMQTEGVTNKQLLNQILTNRLQHRRQTRQ